MKKLTCEMCGSTDLIKQDGVFVCQACGTKYSVEEAKKMMVEGAVDVSGSTVIIDRNSEMENFQNLMLNAFNSQNYKEAEGYASKVLEISDDYLAYYVKGTSAGWQSSIANLRLQEAVHNWTIALEKVPLDGSADELCKNISDDFIAIGNALVDMCFQTYDDFSDNRFVNSVNTLRSFKLKQIVSMIVAYKGRFPEDVRNAKDFDPSTKYLLPELPYLSALSFKRYYDKKFDAANNVINIYKGSSRLSNSASNTIAVFCLSWTVCYHFLPLADQEECLHYCKTLMERVRGKFNANGWNGSIISEHINTLGVKIQEVHKNFLDDQKKQAAKEAEIQNQRIQKYWAEHPEEKKELENRIASLHSKKQPIVAQQDALMEQVNDLRREMAKTLPIEGIKKNHENNISILREKISSLGLFKGKEKKAIQAQIEEKERALAEIERQVKQERAELDSRIQAQIDGLNEQLNSIKGEIGKFDAEIDKINAELTRNR